MNNGLILSSVFFLMGYLLATLRATSEMDREIERIKENKRAEE